ncbi:MAG: DUF2249 domain-containing protein [Trebonia sp.]
MSTSTPEPAESDELDVREVPKPKRHPLIFGRFETLGVGESFVLVNRHDPKHLRQEFDRDHPGAYDWQYLQSGEDHTWRIRIGRRTAADLPRLLTDTAALTTSAADGDPSGAVWRLDPGQRHLDANVIRLPADGKIDAHVGPDLDVLMHVLAGAGQLITVADPVPLAPGALVWLPRRSQRAIVAGPDGLVYLTVHPRRPGLQIV